MPPQQFRRYLSNLVEMDLIDPRALLILFGGEFLNHPQCLDICRIAAETAKPTMRWVIITSGKYQKENTASVEGLMDQYELFHHWEVSVKDFESFQFGMRLLEKGHAVLFRYDYLNSTHLKASIQRFFQSIRLSGKWKEFRRDNPALEKDLRRARKAAFEKQDTVIIEEFFYSKNDEERSAGLTFSPLDRSVMRKGGARTEAKCSLFNSQYQKAIHLCADGTIYPCHLPRFKKRCQPLGNAADQDFLRSYWERIEEFREALLAQWDRDLSKKGVCIEGCRGKISVMQHQ